MNSPLPFDPALTCENYNDTEQKDHIMICPECGKSFLKSVISAHLETHSEHKPFECDQCDKSFAARSYLLKHAKIHVVKKDHICPECKKVFVQRKHLVEHVLTNDCGKRFKCPFCPRKFNQKAHLHKHKIIHKRPLNQTKVNPDLIECHLCQQTFANKVDFKRHMLIHAGKKPFVCSEKNCSMSFVRYEMLQKHIKLIHLGIKDFKCKICDSGFGHKGNLAMHMKIHGKKKAKAKEENENWIVEIPANTKENPKVKGKRGRKRETEEKETQDLKKVFLVEDKNHDSSEMDDQIPEFVDNDIWELENYEKELESRMVKSTDDFDAICRKKLSIKEEFVLAEIETFNKSILTLYPKHRNWVISSFVQELDVSQQIVFEKRGRDYWKFKCFPALESGIDSAKVKISWKLQPESATCSDSFYPLCIKYIIQVFNDFLDNVSEEQEIIPKNDALMYIEMQVNYLDEVMVLVTSHNCDEIIQDSLKNYLSHHDDDVNIWLNPENEWNLKSLYYQTSQSKPELLYGVPEVYLKFDELKLGMAMTIRSSLGASSLQVLIDSIENYLEPCKSTSLVELGCGGGQIGLLLASKFGRVFGIDSISNIREATKLCLSNNMPEVVYIPDKLESVEKLFKMLQNDEQIFAIVHHNCNYDLSTAILEKLKTLKPLKRFVLVTTFPSRSFPHLKTLVGLKRNAFGSFVPTNCCVVDTKPGENGFHCVMLLERVMVPGNNVTVKQK